MLQRGNLGYKRKEERTVAQYYPYIIGYTPSIEYELLRTLSSNNTPP